MTKSIGSFKFSHRTVMRNKRISLEEKMNIVLGGLRALFRYLNSAGSII
ncbi:MAG: hypothetical protein QXQ46_11735 [Thermoplasmatales archaeon]